MYVARVPPLDGGPVGRDILGEVVLPSALLAAAVFAACLFGIFSRPVGFLATVWPANAVMLGLLLRVPGMAKPLGWMAAAIGYLAADLLTGGTFFKTSLLTLGNMAGVAAAYLLFSCLPKDVAQLRQPASTLYLILASALGAAAAGLVGAVANPILFNGSALSGWSFWFATELVNYMAILPVILTAPSPASIFRMRWRKSQHITIAGLAPAFALIVSCVAGVIVGGPGAIAFPVPALLWCGLAYPLFSTALLTLLFSGWTLFAILAGLLPGAVSTNDENALISVRIGVSLIALAPVMLASVMAARNDLFASVQYLAGHDQLTGIANRRAFREQAGALLSRLVPPDRPAVLLMIDIDHFKSVNDEFGHAAGDEVLVAFTSRVKGCLRPLDLFARLGGEEFAILLTDCPREQAIAVGERIRETLSRNEIRLAEGAATRVTASIGAAFCPDGQAGIDQFLLIADKALYQAKTAGRNRLEVYDLNFGQDTQVFRNITWTVPAKAI